MKTLNFLLFSTALLVGLSGCVPQSGSASAPHAESTTTPPAPTPRAWGLSPAEAYAVGTWDCTLSLNGADLPYGVVITMSDSGAYSVDIGGSGVLQNYSMTVADGDVLAFGEPGSPEGDLGKVARVEGFPAELPAPGESVTISRYPDGADSPDMQFTVSVDADVVHVENPTFGADAMDCRRA